MLAFCQLNGTPKFSAISKVTVLTHFTMEQISDKYQSLKLTHSLGRLNILAAR